MSVIFALVVCGSGCFMEQKNPQKWHSTCKATWQNYLAKGIKNMLPVWLPSCSSSNCCFAVDRLEVTESEKKAESVDVFDMSSSGISVALVPVTSADVPQ